MAHLPGMMPGCAVGEMLATDRERNARLPAGAWRPAGPPGEDSYPRQLVHRPRFLAPPSAGASPEAVMLRLTATVEPGQAGDLASTVLARAARPGAGASTIVLVLDGTVDSDCLEALALLQDRLRALGTCLRLVIGPRGSGQPREPAASTSVTSLAIHPSLRSAVLAVFAARLGPG